MLNLRARTTKELRRTMVQRQIVKRGVKDRRVVAVMAWVPRELFVPEDCVKNAYADTPLPIGADQTISQPYIVALMTAAAQLTRHSRVLEIGTGSGYQTAVIAKIVKHVWSIERVESFIPTVQRRLHTLHIDNVTLIAGDGALGHQEASPYDAIIVAAAASAPPQPLLDQLSVGGRMIIPLGSTTTQMLTAIERTDDAFITTPLSECRFVPFVMGESNRPARLEATPLIAHADLLPP